MSESAGVLIVTNERDIDADYVVRLLVDGGVPVVRLNTERAARWTLALQPGRQWTAVGFGREIASGVCAGVWWRRPEPPQRPRTATDTEWDAAVAQWFGLLHGMQHVPGPRWLSPPAAIRAAEGKALQLGEASAVGFPVPETVWTNDVGCGRRLLDGHDGSGIVKSTATAYWEQHRTAHFVFAHAVDAGALPPAARLAGVPVAFQQRIRDKRDIRVTVVGGEVFAAVTDDATDSQPDWRLAENAAWTTYDLPEREQRRCVELVARLGLRFAGIDLLADGDGNHWFCELNPNGEWGWLQAAGSPIAEAIVGELLAS